MKNAEIKKLMEEWGEKSFRVKQCWEAVLSGEYDDWGEVSNLSKGLREKLEWEVRFLEVEEKEVREAGDGSVKALLRMEDGMEVESVLMPAGERRYTVCLSSQVGCGMGCSFCATGKLGLKRNLMSEEIRDQFLFWQRWVKKNREGERVGGAVVMGMGEPMLNLENVGKALGELAEGLDMAKKHFAVSTAGVVPGIRKMLEIKDLEGVRLAVSLHSAEEELRRGLMPGVAGGWSLKELKEAMEEYVKARGEKVMIEYLMLRGVNDSLEQARKLTEYLGDPRKYHVNLLRYNSAEGGYRASEEGVIKEFQGVVRRRGFDCTRRKSWGVEVGGACGQLAGGKK